MIKRKKKIKNETKKNNEHLIHQVYMYLMVSQNKPEGKLSCDPTQKPVSSAMVYPLLVDWICTGMPNVINGPFKICCLFFRGEDSEVSEDEYIDEPLIDA